MDAQKPLFLEGAADERHRQAKADEVWNLLDKFANYGFNKSHAAAYAVVSYQTAWLKANHPVEFMAAVMNCDIHLTDKLGGYKQECDRLGIAIRPPCVNRSAATFAVEDGAILYGARRAEGRRRRGDAADRGGARRGRAVRRALRLRRPRRPAPGGQDRRWRCSPAPGRSTRSTRNRRKAFDEPRGADRPIPPRRMTSAPRRRSACSARRPRRCPRRACRERRGLGPDRAAGAGARGGRLLPLGPPARRLPRAAAPAGRADPRRAAAQGRAAPRRSRRGSPGRWRRSSSASRRAAPASPSCG